MRCRTKIRYVSSLNCVHCQRKRSAEQYLKVKTGVPRRKRNELSVSAEAVRRRAAYVPRRMCPHGHMDLKNSRRRVCMTCLAEERVRH